MPAGTSSCESLSGLAMRKPPSVWDKLRSPFMAMRPTGQRLWRRTLGRSYGDSGLGVDLKHEQSGRGRSSAALTSGMSV